MSWIVNEFLAPDAVALGRLVLSIEDPSQDFFPSHPLPSTLPTPEDVSLIRYDSFQETLSAARGSRLAAFLTRLLTLSTAGSNSRSSVIQATKCLTYTLKNQTDFFTRLCADPAARAWLERAIASHTDVYLVTGIKTLTDAKVVLRKQAKSDSDVNVKVPLDAALLAGGVPIPPGIIGDVGASAGRSDESSVQARFSVPGEQIFAAQFRRIEFRLWRRRTVDAAVLARGNRWTVYPGERARERGISPRGMLRGFPQEAREGGGGEEGAAVRRLSVNGGNGVRPTSATVVEASVGKGVVGAGAGGEDVDVDVDVQQPSGMERSETVTIGDEEFVYIPKS